MSVFDKYMIRNIAVSTLFVALTLSVIIFLTQSLKFLELVIESGASSGVFWQLTFLALPRFFEFILPVAVMVAVVFVYSRMISDSEVVVLRASGYSALELARPALLFALFVTVLLMAITMWVGPKSVSKLQDMRQTIKSQFSMLFFKEGVFNQIGKGLTVYIREKDGQGVLRGIVIHDSRAKNPVPSTVIARQGMLVGKDGGFEVLVQEGSRQEYDSKKQILNRLNFDRYTIDLPNSEEVTQRWVEPDERTIWELMSPDLSDQNDVRYLDSLRLEIHKRFISPFLALTYALLGCATLLLGPYDRRGQARRIVLAIVATTVLQGLYLSAFNIAEESVFGLILMYGIVFVPLALSYFVMCSRGEVFRRKLLYGVRP